MPVMRPEQPGPQRGEIRAEIAAMETAYEAFASFDFSTQERALTWLTSRLGADWAKQYADEEPPF